MNKNNWVPLARPPQLHSGKRKRIPGDRLGRHQEFLREVAAEFTPEVFLPEEAAAILFGRLETGKRVIKGARLRLLMNKSETHSLPPLPRQEAEGLALPRPVCTLSRLNRTKVFPPLLPPSIKVQTLRFTEILDLVRAHSLRGAPSHRLLDLLVAGSGLSWLTSAELLVKRQIIGRPIDAEDVETTRQARLFWTLYSEGRARCLALARANEIPSRSGDWAFFDHPQLAALLPGIILPDHCRRREYLTLYASADECLDAYSVSGLPLVRHPFLRRFNPLIFGKLRRLGSS